MKVCMEWPFLSPQPLIKWTLKSITYVYTVPYSTQPRYPSRETRTFHSGRSGREPSSSRNLQVAVFHVSTVEVASNVLRVATNESQWSQTFYKSQPISRSGFKRSTSRKPTSRSSGLLNVRFANQFIYINF